MVVDLKVVKHVGDLVRLEAKPDKEDGQEGRIEKVVRHLEIQIGILNRVHFGHFQHPADEVHCRAGVKGSL